MVEWYEDDSELQRTAIWLAETDVLSSALDAIRFFEKPWKWTPERDHMLTHERIERDTLAQLKLEGKVGVVESALDRLVEAACPTCTPPNVEEA